MNGGRPGFTLLELIATLLITGLVVGIGHLAFRQIIVSRERASPVIDRTQAATTARVTIVQWLASAHVEGREDGIPFEGIDPSGEGVSDRLNFVTTAAQPVLDGTALIELYVDSDSATSERGLVAKIRGFGGQSRKLELVPLATGLDAWFLGTVDGVHSWVPSWSSAVELPEAVRLAVLTVESDSVAAIVRVPITIPLSKTQ
jgi:prepilin-type N-terminal cleavage/methylation domain-containing protein